MKTWFRCVALAGWLLQAAAVQAAVVGHWRFEGGGATLLEDNSGNGLALTVSGTSPVATPVSGTDFPTNLVATAQANTQAVDFGLGQVGHLTVTDAPIFSLVRFTVEAFARGGKATTGTQYLASQWHFASGNQRSWGLGVAGSAPFSSRPFSS